MEDRETWAARQPSAAFKGTDGEESQSGGTLRGVLTELSNALSILPTPIIDGSKPKLMRSLLEFPFQQTRSSWVI
jgi:hypothetical protein